MATDNSQYDSYTDNHENGQKKSEGYYLEGKRESKWTQWYESGQKKLETDYKAGKEDGKWTEWYESGQKKLEIDYKAGKKDGKWSQWNEDGQIDQENSYKDGKYHGMSYYWDIDGNLIAQTLHSNNELAWSYPKNINKNFNMGALEGGAFVIPDEDISEVIKVFPKELLHTPFMNLWMTWYIFNENLATDSEHEHEKNHTDANQLLLITFDRMRNIIPSEHWHEIAEEYYPNETSAWWLDDNKLYEACRVCFYKHRPEYSGFIQDDAGFPLAYELDHEFLGKWSLNPNDKFWKTEESMNRYYRYFFWRDKTGEELYKNLIEVFGKNNLPPWANEIRDRDKK